MNHSRSLSTTPPIFPPLRSQSIKMGTNETFSPPELFGKCRGSKSNVGEVISSRAMPPRLYGGDTTVVIESETGGKAGLRRASNIVPFAKVLINEFFQLDVGENIATINNKRLSLDPCLRILIPPPVSEIRLVNKLHSAAGIALVPEQASIWRQMVGIDDEGFHPDCTEMIECKVISGLPKIGIKGLGRTSVNGRSLVPNPAPRTNAVPILPLTCRSLDDAYFIDVGLATGRNGKTDLQERIGHLLEVLQILIL